MADIISWDSLLKLSEVEFKEKVHQGREQITLAFVLEGKVRAEQAVDLPTARPILKRLAILTHVTGNPLAMALFWRARSNVLVYFEHFELSMKAARQAAAIYHQHDKPFEVAIARLVDVVNLSALERFDEAISLALSIRPYFENGVLPLAEARVTHSLARSYAASWQLEKALIEYQRAKTLFEADDDLNEDVAWVLHNMGHLATLKDEFDTAQNWLTQAHDAFSKLEKPDRLMMIKTQFNLALNCERQTNYEAALAHLDQARIYLAEMPRSPNAGYVDLYEARVRQKLNQITHANDLVTHAITHFNRLGWRREVAEALVAQSYLLTTQPTSDNLALALSNLQKAEEKLLDLNLTLAVACVQMERVELMLRLGRAHEVISIIKKISSTFDTANLKLRYARMQVLLADCIWRLEPAQARQIYEVGLVIVGEIDLLLAVRCWRGIGHIAMLEGDAIAAEHAYTNAVTMLDELRRSLHSHQHQAGFQEGKQELTEALLAALQEQTGRKVQLLTWLECFKASALADLLIGQPPDVALSNKLRNLFNKREKIARKLDRCVNALSSVTGTQMAASGQRTRSLEAHDLFQTQEIAKLRRQLQTIDEALARQHHPSVAWREGAAITAEGIHHLLDSNTMLISYYSIQNKLHALTVSHTKDDIEIHSMPVDLPEIERQWQQTKPLIEPDRELRPAQRRLARLWEYLIAPLEDRIHGKKRLIILPHRTLFQIPFAGLYDSQNSCYLVQHSAVQLLPSATILHWCRQRPIPSRPPLFVGYPGKVKKPGYLLGVKQELVTLQKFYPQADVLFGAKARAGRVIKEAADRIILHLAGHAFFEPDSPLESGLPLADGRWLRASDLYLRYGYLNGTTIVLSGCETGRGQISGADTLGLISAFLYAGAAGVMAGLWKVDDAATCALMQSFYDQLVNQQDVATALQQAQLTLIASDQFTSPYYWAPFSLHGDSRVI